MKLSPSIIALLQTATASKERTRRFIGSARIVDVRIDPRFVEVGVLQYASDDHAKADVVNPSTAHMPVSTTWYYIREASLRSVTHYISGHSAPREATQEDLRSVLNALIAFLDAE